jgi:hypothetical protein
VATLAIRAVHNSGRDDSRRLAASLTRAGCHFLTRAQWERSSFAVSAVLCVEADREDEVRLMVPPVFRLEATVTRVR